MNDLYLIGNGFDLAHGLKTSYNDFLLWYLKKAIAVTGNHYSFEDDLLIIQGNASFFLNEDIKTIRQALDIFNTNNPSLVVKDEFFRKIIKSYREFKWVDIEYEYYAALVELYKKLERIENQVDLTYKQKHEKKGAKIKDLEELNNCFAFILNELEKYLDDARKKRFDNNKQIEEILFEETGTPETREIEYFKEAFDNNSEKFNEKKLFVSFNYTTTMASYLRNSTHEKNLIYIHGELNDPSNPIIFGYGDEMDPFYEQIENLNNNEFLKNIKSFSYFKTNNYQRVVRFVESGDFTVKILGHSCGLSDRILLNTIFEHPNCKAIKIYYYQKSETENDYFEKTQEISRHFKASGKGYMRTKIVPFIQSVPLLPFVPKN